MSDERAAEAPEGDATRPMQEGRPRRRLLPQRLIAALRPDAGARFEWPSEMVRESRRRVRTGAAIGAAAYLLYLGLQLSGQVHTSGLELKIDVAHDLLGLGVCVVLFLLSSLRSLADRHVFAAALVSELLLTMLISLLVPWAMFVRTGFLSYLSWVVPIIILFPLLVPSPPRTALIISVLCAATMPAGLAVLDALGKITPHASDFWATSVTGAIAVGIAMVASRTVYSAGRQVAAARTIGSYELLERLGRGGMGEVWKARHLMLARPAAVKLILPEQLRGPTEAREAALQRFTREAQVTAGLRSAHTVQLFDFGVSSDHALYYAMELLDGMTVEHFVYRFGPLEPRRAVHWLQQACHSLGEAHANHLIHRDIKPANLFLCRYGRDVDFIKLLDFGLTRPVAAEDDAHLTRPGWRLGTPGYMAPEQVYGLEVGPATDLYALGCVGYWLLSGERPFDAETVGDLLRKHAQTPPPPLSQKTSAPVPPRLEALIMACLSKRPEDRPHDADALNAALATCLDEAPWSNAEAHAWWEKNLSEL
jgi:eukaryotic-like serine/threonine-protein kinase